MKKLNILMIALLAIVLGGCKEKDDSYYENRVTTSRFTYTVDKVNFEGHIYLIINANYKSGICHDENCKCKTDSIK